jgi:ribosomal-protein-alanine N-acetyltransferase
MSKVEQAREVPETAGSAWRVERMTEHDLLEVVEIEETTGLSRWGWEAYFAELIGGHDGLMLVARELSATENRDDKCLAGFVASRMIADELHINNIAVRPARRRRGIGGALLEAVLLGGANVGARVCLLEVRASNHAAQALYEHYGFRVAGRRAGYYTSPPEDALVMRRALDVAAT